MLDRLGGDIPPEVRFVLVGKHNALGVNESLAKKYPDIVLDYVGVTDLAGTYGLIASCDAFIGPDGGNINAAIAMLPPGGVFPIYGMVNPEARLPGGFPQENIIRGRCPLGDGGCFERVQ